LEALIQKRFHAQMFASLGKDDKNALEYLESILFARVGRPPYTLNRKFASMLADRPRSRVKALKEKVKQMFHPATDI
jgi:hypothetical protein